MLPILLDSETLFRQWRAQRKKALAEVAKVRERLADFESRGDDCYREWLHRTFPGLLTEIRLKREKVSEIDRLIHATDYEARWSRLRKADAYRLILERNERHEPLISETAVAAERAHTEAERLESERIRESMREKFREATFDPGEFVDLLHDVRMQLFSELGIGAFRLSDGEVENLIRNRLGMEEAARARAERFEEEYGDPSKFRSGFERVADEPENDHLDRADDDAQDSGPTRATSTLRSLYRELSRKLHPDANAGRFDDSARRLWNEVQVAYGAADIGRLSALRAFILRENGAEPPPDDESVSSLMEEVSALRETLRDLRRSERRRQSDPAFRLFRLETAKRPPAHKIAELARIIGLNLYEDLRDATAAMRDREHDLKKFSAPAPKRRASRLRER